MFLTLRPKYLSEKFRQNALIRCDGSTKSGISDRPSSSPIVALSDVKVFQNPSYILFCVIWIFKYPLFQ